MGTLLQGTGYNFPRLRVNSEKQRPLINGQHRIPCALFLFFGRWPLSHYILDLPPGGPNDPPLGGGNSEGRRGGGIEGAQCKDAP